MALALLQEPLKSPKSNLAIVFTLWKSLLFFIAFLSPRPGYDTSTTLLEGVGNSSSLLPFIRWDAIYFTETTRRGYVFEQEWAFSWTLTRAISFLAKFLQLAGISPSIAPSAAGIITANTSHGLAVIVLYELTLRVFRSNGSSKKLAYIAACLHIISPAGMFLSAPYAESSFALLHFLGMLLFIESSLRYNTGSVLQSEVLLVLSGAAIGLATAVRSNGLASGLYFAHTAVVEAFHLVRGNINLARLRRLACVIIAGSLVALGTGLPQVVAYQEYCKSTDAEPRPWCNELPPSIYKFVQEYYWNNGWLRYWTVSNIPLFALAIPILSILSLSSVWAFTLQDTAGQVQGKGTSTSSLDAGVTTNVLLPLFAAPQAFIAIYILTTAHVQIATRLSSGYPVWYWWLASSILPGDATSVSSRWNLPKIVIRWMVMYSLIQGGLYAAFLPPA